MFIWERVNHLMSLWKLIFDIFTFLHIAEIAMCSLVVNKTWWWLQLTKFASVFKFQWWFSLAHNYLLNLYMSCPVHRGNLNVMNLFSIANSLLIHFSLTVVSFQHPVYVLNVGNSESASCCLREKDIWMFFFFLFFTLIHISYSWHSISHKPVLAWNYLNCGLFVIWHINNWCKC